MSPFLRGTDINHFFLGASWSDGCHASEGGLTPQSGATCSPLSATYDLGTIGTVCGCTVPGDTLVTIPT